MHGDPGPVVLINLFQVPTGADEAFIAAWERARDFLAAQEGYRSTELHQSLGPDAEFRFVNVAEWASPVAFKVATAQPDFPGRDMPFPAHPPRQNRHHRVSRPLRRAMEKENEHGEGPHRACSLARRVHQWAERRR